MKVGLVLSVGLDECVEAVQQLALGVDLWVMGTAEFHVAQLQQQ